MNTQILILVDYLHFLRNDLNRTSSLNLDTIQSLLTENGFNVEIKSFQEITKTNSIPKNKFIWYAGSDFASYKAYIEDILHYIKQDNHLIPPFDILRAHNNKGYQGLLFRYV